MRTQLVFFDLCDMDNNGNISQKEIYEVLKGNIASSEDRQKLRKVIARLFVECDENGDGVLDKQELYSAAKDNITLRQLLEESIRNLKQIDQIIKNDLEEPFHCWVPLSANFVNYKEGIHFPLVNKIIEVLKEIENVTHIPHSNLFLDPPAQQEQADHQGRTPRSGGCLVKMRIIAIHIYSSNEVQVRHVLPYLVEAHLAERTHELPLPHLSALPAHLPPHQPKTPLISPSPYTPNSLLTPFKSSSTTYPFCSRSIHLNSFCSFASKDCLSFYWITLPLLCSPLLLCKFGWNVQLLSTRSNSSLTTLSLLLLYSLLVPYLYSTSCLFSELLLSLVFRMLGLNEHSDFSWLVWIFFIIDILFSFLYKYFYPLS